MLDLATGTAVKLVERPGGKIHPRWSPDGRQIAFLSWLDPNFSYSRHTLFVAAVSESLEAATPSPARVLTAAAFDYDLNEFVWSRHDGVIYAIAAVGTQSEVYAITAEATTRQEREKTEAELEDIDADAESGTLVYVQETNTALPEICLRAPDGAVHTLTKLNAEFAETYRLPRQEVVRWTSPDGLSIEGVLTYPLDYEEGTRVPLIVQIHGGPKGRATNTLRSYSMPPVWAAEGYAVLQPNFRGSEGYGNAFALANRRDLGGGDFADIMAGVDWCLAQGIADPERLGVMGGSYGGFMTNWAIGHTDRFRAAISMFGIFHLQTDYSNSELSRWDNEYLGAYYWEDPEIYRRLSPGSYIENIKTPTLILHGDEDNNTFISNSKELYQALRHRGVTTQFVHYPREGHGLGEPNHKLDELRRCLAWMDRYVRHGGQNPGVYRLGDKVPSADGLLELCVTSAEIATFLGQPKPEPGAAETGLLEIAFTLHNLDSRQPVAPMTLSLESVRLEEQAEVPGASVLTPIGVPFNGPGGKALVEGENLRIAQHPDAETGQLAFACAVVFRVGKESREGLLRVADFPPVALHWSLEENPAKNEKESAKETANDPERLPG
ncbi:MAG TPA: S9 family peptidase [Chthonomonadaceae bacterium]|nr:S9 family peptidase [Chthonomonadaceae bacterium]